VAGIVVKTELEILDLRHFSARQLRSLLEQEARVWQHRLRWDYTGATELLLQYLDSRILPGFVALDRGRICGYCFCVYEGAKAVVGDAFAVENSALDPLDTTRELLRHLLQVLRHSPEIDRVESQLLLYNSGDLASVFHAEGFQTFRRLFMEVNLGRLRATLDPGTLQTATLAASGLELRRWMPADYQPVAELIHVAYEDHIDSRINDQYRSLNGSLRFLHNIVRFPGCGAFDARSSWVLYDPRTRGLAGVLLCSRVRHDTAHITQLCIGKDYRGLHLGGLMMRNAMRDLSTGACEAITLTVTEANLPAVRLYADLNFTIRHAFDAHVKDSTPHRLI
jgi:ribosomal protein S18 acetylase RimI-like enzyme